MRPTRLMWIGLALMLALVLTACAPGPNPEVGTAGADGGTAGLLLGLWQGFIVPVTFVVSLFTDTVSVYEVNNTGNLYDLGYVLGVSAAFTGGSGGAYARRRRR